MSELIGTPVETGMAEQPVSLDRFREIVSEEMDELPQEFFKELNNGVVVQEGAKIHPKDAGNDLYIMGEYHRSYSAGRGITLYYGSFLRMLRGADDEAFRRKIREVLRHEFRHHLEGLSGLRDLEIEDEAFLKKYLDSVGKPGPR